MDDTPLLRVRDSVTSFATDTGVVRAVDEVSFEVPRSTTVVRPLAGTCASATSSSASMPSRPLGAFPTTVEHVDLLAADAHKWLLGPCGAGVMYVRGSVQPSINPPIYGWNNVRCPNFVAQEQIILRTGSQKYEAGTHNLLGIVGLVTAMGMLVELGVENIARELLRKRARLVPALQAKGCTVLQADAPPEAGSGIVSFTQPGRDLAALHQKLLDAGIVTSLRADRSGQKYSASRRTSTTRTRTWSGWSS